MAGTGSVVINFVTALPTTANVGAHRIHTSNGLLQGYNGTAWVQYGSGGGAGGAAISAAGNSVSSGTVVFSNSNGVSFGMSGSTITATVTPGPSAGIGAIGASTQTATSGTVILSASNGITFGMSGSTRITGSHDGIRSVSAGTTNVVGPSYVLSNSNNVSFGANGSTITASASYSQSTAPAAIAAGTQTVTNGTVVLSNANGISFGLNASTVTASVAAGATATGNLGALAAGTQTATSGSVAFIDSNGISFGMSASTRITASYTVPSTAGLISAINISAGTTSTNASAVVFSNANGVTFGLNAGTVTGSVAAAGGGYTLSSFEPAPFIANTGTAVISLSSNTSGAMMLFPMQLAAPVAAELMGIVVSMNFTTGGTSSFRQSGTLQWGLYTRPTGTNSTQLRIAGSDSLSYAVTYNNSSISVSQVTTTNVGPSYGYAQTVSAGLNISSGYTGLKLLNLDIGTTLTAGQYWFGLHHINSSSSFNSGIRLSLYGSAYTLTGLAPMGSFSSAYSTGTNVVGGLGGNMYLGLGSYSLAGLTSLPGTISISQITQAGVNLLPYWRLSTRVT